MIARPTETTVKTRSLKTDQIAVRHVIPRDLLLFSGRPEEWQMFLSTYETSTEICRYSEEENLPRLQRSLKGAAMEAVRFRLITPSGVPGAIEILRMLYCRPEVIINHLITAIRKEPAPKIEKLEALIQFALAEIRLGTIQTVVANR